jgi:hypothetical protein
MTENAEDPVGQASSRIVQYVSLATMAAEALAQRAQQRTAAAAATNDRAAAALRAQQTAARNAARLQWQPVLDPRRGADNSLGDAGLAWAASQAWRDVDPEAALASDRALERMRELRPDVMARFDRLTTDGLDQVEAMRRVAPFLDRPAARGHGGATRPELAVGDPEASVQAAADSATRAAGDQSAQSAGRTAVVDDPRSPHVDERLDADALAEPHQHKACAQAGRAAALQNEADQSQDVVLVASGRTPPQLAHEAYPEALTGEVLAAGKVKPKTPDRTAPAAVRSTGLATAARAARASNGGRGR